MQIEKTIGRNYSPKHIRRLVRQNYTHYAYFFFESLLLSSLTPRDRPFFDRAFRIVNGEALKRALALNRGVFLLSGHIGFWEALGPVITFNFRPITVVVKRIQVRFIQRIREILQAFPGVRLLDSETSGFRALSLMKTLRRGEIVGIIQDQHRPSADFAKFFGYDVRTNATAAVLSRRNGAPVLLTYVLRNKFRKYDVIFVETDIPPTAHLESREAVRIVNDYLNGLFESVIQKHPEQWLWAHRRFKDNSNFVY